MMQRVMQGMLLCCVLASPAWAEDADAILGLWNTEGEESQVEIHACGEGLYCGKIVALKQPLYGDEEAAALVGKPKVDRKNPDESLRTRPILGLPLLQNFRYSGKNRWKEGRIYDPKSGKTYRCTLTLKDNGELKVRGFVGISLLGRTTVWQRPG